MTDRVTIRAFIRYTKNTQLRSILLENQPLKRSSNIAEFKL